MSTVSPATLNDSVSAEVRAEMGRQRISQTQLSLAVGWKQAYLSRRITGLVAWSTDDLEQLAKSLGIPVHALISPRAVSA